MSSSDSDIDYDIPAPKDVKVKRGGGGGGGMERRGGKTKPLVPPNREDEREGRPRRGKKRTSDQVREEEEEEEEEDFVLNSDDDDVLENHPPPATKQKIAVVESDEEDQGGSGDSKQTQSNVRQRRRLSIRSRQQEDPAVVPGSQQQPPPDSETLRKIYSTCMDMYKAQKITVENAFNIRFLDLMVDIVEMPDFDKQDLMGAGRMLEAGARIYVCRVDKTKHTVLDLASTLQLQQRARKQKGKVNDGAAPGDEMMGEGGEDDRANDEDYEEERSKKKRKKAKERNFVVDDSKITLPFELGLWGEARRNALKGKLIDLIDNDVDFDYFEQFLEERPPTCPESLEEQMACFGNDEFLVPDAVVDRTEFTTLEHLPMRLMENFDKSVFDPWGHRLNGSTVHAAMNGDMDAVEDNFLEHEGQVEVPYVAQDQPPLADYGPQNNSILEDDRFGNETFVEDDGIEGTQEPVLGTKIKSLEEFYTLYERAKSMCAWCPTFVKSSRFALMPGKGLRKPRVKKDPVFVDVLGIDKRDAGTKYKTDKDVKGVFDERAIERWSINGRHPHPFLEVDEVDDEFEEVVRLINEDEKLATVPELFRFFIDPNRNLLSVLRILPSLREVEDGFQGAAELPNGGIDEDYVNDAGFEVERHMDMDASYDVPMGENGNVMDIPLTGDTREPSDMNSFNFHICLSNLLMESTEPPDQEGTTSTVRFARRPKPIDMHGLKRAIVEHLEESLQLDDDDLPTLDVETQTDFLSLLKYVLGSVDVKTAENLSIAILCVGLLHVVVEKNLFVTSNPSKPSNPLIVCRGKLWNHADHIPLPVVIEDDD